MDLDHDPASVCELQAGDGPDPRPVEEPVNGRRKASRAERFDLLGDGLGVATPEQGKFEGVAAPVHGALDELYEGCHSAI